MFMNSSMSVRKYAPFWSKYRPVILKMMLDALHEPQQYKILQHEFQAMDDRKKKAQGFQLQVFQSRAVNDIKNSEPAQDLLHMLMQSRKGTELTGTHQFEIVLDREFMLHVSTMQRA